MKYSNKNLDTLLKQGLRFWIADYQIAKENNKTQLADTIFEGIQFYKERLSKQEQQKLNTLLENNDYLINEDYNNVEVEANALYIIEQMGKEEQLNEGVISRAIGAVGGFAVGPAIGKIVADVLGVEKRSMLRDFLESRLVGSSLGSAITKNFGE